MKFEREDTPTIMDGLVVRYRCGSFEINASRNGVSSFDFMPLIRDQEELDVVIEYLRRAFRQYVQLRTVYKRMISLSRGMEKYPHG
jgi:hypothetical protein